MLRFIWFPYFSFISGFQSWFYHIHRIYPYRSFKHSNWWRHKLDHI